MSTIPGTKVDYKVKKVSESRSLPAWQKTILILLLIVIVACFLIILVQSNHIEELTREIIGLDNEIKSLTNNNVNLQSTITVLEQTLRSVQTPTPRP